MTQPPSTAGPAQGAELPAPYGDSTGSLYHFDGRFYHPQPVTTGPWNPDAQHGGPVAALLAGALEAGGGSALVRMTVELLRPVPLRALSVERRVVKSGRTVTLIDATISAGGVEVATARGLNLRRSDLAMPPKSTSFSPPIPSPQPAHAGARRTAFAAAVEMRFVEGSWDEMGPATLWTRLRVPVVDHEPVTAMQRAAAAADFANGISRVVDFETHSFINADLTVAISRSPQDDWIGFEMASHVSGQGTGHAESRIFDTAGTLGRSIQSLIVTEKALPADS